MVRIPDSDRFRTAPARRRGQPTYLLPAVVLAAGLDGMANKTNPGKRLDTNMYTDRDAKAKKLPQTLHEALGKLAASSVLKKGLGEEFISSYLTIKHAEWSALYRPDFAVGT